MKTQSVRSFFKKSAAKNAKRADLNWTFQALEAADLPTIPEDQICKVLNLFTESFGRKLIAQNGEDWNFAPSPELSFSDAYADLIAERTNSRILTKESLAAFGAFYKENAISKLGVSAVAAATGEKVISQKLASIAGKNDVLEVLARRIESLVEACAEDEVLPHAEVIEKILELIEELKAAEISADAL